MLNHQIPVMEHRALSSREHAEIKKISNSPNICEEPSIASHIMYYYSLITG